MITKRAAAWSEVENNLYSNSKVTQRTAKTVNKFMEESNGAGKERRGQKKRKKKKNRTVLE